MKPHPPSASELVRLVRAAQAGRGEALRALFDQYQRKVMAYCLVAAGGDRDLAMDFTQETFARAFRHLGRLSEPERFPGWLFTIAGNVCRTRGGQEARRRAVLEELALQGDEALPSEAARREERIRLVQQLLAGIEDEQLRRVVQLKYGEPEHTTRAIAEKLGMPHGTVTVKLMRFRAAVRRELLSALLGEEESP